MYKHEADAIITSLSFENLNLKETKKGENWHGSEKLKAADSVLSICSSFGPFTIDLIPLHATIKPSTALTMHAGESEEILQNSNVGFNFF